MSRNRCISNMFTQMWNDVVKFFKRTQPIQSPPRPHGSVPLNALPPTSFNPVLLRYTLIEPDIFDRDVIMIDHSNVERMRLDNTPSNLDFFDLDYERYKTDLVWDMQEKLNHDRDQK